MRITRISNRRGETLGDQLAAALSRPDATEPGECWTWGGTHIADGYGHVQFGGRVQLVHRIAAESAYGPIGEGLVVDHLCRNRECFRPSHLRICTPRENTMADGSMALAAKWASRTHCEKGHPLSGDNLVTTTESRRRCRVCDTQRRQGGTPA